MTAQKRKKKASSTRTTAGKAAIVGRSMPSSSRGTSRATSQATSRATSQATSRATSPAASSIREGSTGCNEDVDGEGDITMTANDTVESSEDEETELERLRNDWTAPVYAFFDPVPTITYVDGRRCHEFRCAAKSCLNKVRVVRRYLDTGDSRSTGNLRKHAKRCWGDDTVKLADGARDVEEVWGITKGERLSSALITTAFERKGKGKITYSHRQHTKTEAKAEIIRWVAESLRPFSIVSDRGFMSLMKTGRPGYYIPSPSTVSRDVKQVFIRVRKRMAKMLQEHRGALNFGTDAWTSPNNKAYVAVTVHYEVAGSEMCVLLDLVEVNKSHTGRNLAEAFAAIVDGFGIKQKMLSITCDNASCNDVMIDELAKQIENFPGAPNRTQCFAHVLNLVAKSIIRNFDVPKSKADRALNEAESELFALADNLDVEDNEVGGADDEDDDGEADDEDGLVDLLASMSKSDRDSFETSVTPVRLVLLKLRRIANAIKRSTTIIAPTWFGILEKHGLKGRMMPRDVSTRWNSTFDMLVFALDYQLAVDELSADRKVKLRQYEMSSQEWAIARQLADILKILKDGTLFFSRATPNLATVIPAMDHIDHTLATHSVNSRFAPSIRASLALGKKTLNRYYNLTDDSEVYCIAMILHPRHKLTYFKTAKWEQEWIDVARQILEDEYNRAYNKDKDGNAANPPSPSIDACNQSANIFDNLPALATPTSVNASDEIELYLSTGPIDVSNVLKWWVDREKTYPNLSRMALDYLSIPATSADVERVFSRGRLLLSHTRNRLSVQSTRALMCLGSWSQLGLVMDQDVVAVTAQPDLQGEEEELLDNWDAIS